MKKNVEDPTDPRSVEYKYNKTKMRRKETQLEYEKDYAKSLAQQKESIKKNEGPEIRERMLEERRKWIMDVFETNEGNSLPAKITEFYKKDDVEKPLNEDECNILINFFLV